MRLTIAGAAVMCAVAWGHGVSASSASASLGVSVTVVRSCAVQARAVDAMSAAVRLACSSGHVSGVLVGRTQLSPPRGLVRVEETGTPASGQPGVRIVTLNF